ncbi:MAG: maltokinase N-terminal cap-like domain-containing protein [Myxococcales bacterium]
MALPIDMQSLPAWLSRQRWFGGKGAAIAGVRDVDRAQLSPGLLLSAVEVRYEPPRPAESYALALRPWTGKGGIVEGLDDDAARALLGIVRGRLRVATAAGALQGERFDGPGSPMERLSRLPAVRRLGAEQSNTSLVFDDRVILKLIRKLEPGVNPELEMGAFLARSGFRGTPPILGAISATGALNATVAVAHAFVHVESDGWSYVLDALRRGEPPLSDVRELGARIGELHAALASDDAGAGFAPEPIVQDDLRRWTETLLGELERTVRLAASAVPDLAGRQKALAARIHRLGGIRPGGVRIRQHGDLHLGQVLRSGGEWLVFDFEGEPARPLAERRQKHSPLKDVAGMLRSFAYAAASAGRREIAGLLRESFLQGWRSRAGRLLPADAEAARVLLESLELEKLLYELRYELGHRPDWVKIPAADLLEAR